MAAAAAVFAVSASARAQTIELKVSHFLPANHTFQKAMVAWGDELAKEFNGRLKLDIRAFRSSGSGHRRGLASEWFVR
jgi:TRAP-type C4-dicarboxylate transport system substrate-binding protein